MSEPDGRGIFPADLLDRCISCGFCLPACPTYALTGDEKSSPRGRINLMRALETGSLSLEDPTLRDEPAFCLGCRACEPVCPAGVEYGALLERWRDAEWKGSRRPLIAWALMRAVSSRWLLRLIGTLRRLGEQLPGTIVTTSGGCAAHLAKILGSERVKELSQYLTSTDSQPPGQVTVDGRPARVTLQDSCHLRNGLGVWREPRALIEQVAEYVEMPDAAGCCGAAGTYSLLRPKDSRRVLDPRPDAIETLDADFVVAVNPGCLRQLRTGLRRRRSSTRAVHLAELLDLASDGQSDRNC